MKSSPAPGSIFRQRSGRWGLAATATVTLAFGLLDRAEGPFVGVAVGAGAIVAALLIRILVARMGTVLFLAPLLAAWAYLGLAAPVTVLAELLSVLAALAALAWMAERPHAPPAILRRAGDVLVLPAVGAMIALVSGLLIPPGELRIGVAALLLVIALGLVVLTLGRSHPASEPPSSTL